MLHVRGFLQERHDNIVFLKLKANDDLFISTGMLFQDLAPEKRTDLIPYCLVFFRVKKSVVSFFEACRVDASHTDENLMLIQNIVKVIRRVLIDTIINRAKQF